MNKINKQKKNKILKFAMIFIAFLICINLNIFKSEAYISPNKEYSLYEYKSIRIIIQNLFISSFSFSMPGNGSNRVRGTFVLYDNMEHKDIYKLKHEIDYVDWCNNSCNCYVDNADGAIEIIELPR